MWGVSRSWFRQAIEKVNKRGEAHELKSERAGERRRLPPQPAIISPFMPSLSPDFFAIFVVAAVVVVAAAVVVLTIVVAVAVTVNEAQLK